MPPKRLTEEELQHLLGHVKVRVDPTFNKALQAELRARARELRAASEDLSQGGRLVRNGVPSAHDDAGRDQRPHRGWSLGRLSTISILSSAVLATAALAFVFLVLVRPLLGGRAVEPDLTAEATEDSIALTGYPIDVEPTEGTITDSPTEPPLPTETPTPALTAMASPTPNVGATLTSSAIPTPVVTVTCSWTQVSGYVQMAAPYVRVTVSTAAFPITQIGEAVGPVQQDGSYSVTVSYPEQPAGTRLMGGYGEWDGTSWLHPATTFGADCQPEEAAPTPGSETSTPLLTQLVQFWPDVPVLDRSSTVGFGARIKFESSITTRARMLAFYTYQGESTPGESACMSQQMPGRSGEMFWSTGTYTELAPGTRDFEQSYTYDHSAPGDATHLVMWLILSDTNNQSIACWQKVIELSAVSP